MIQLTYKNSLLIIASVTLFISSIWSSNNDNAILAYGQEQEQVAPTITTTTTTTTSTLQLLRRL
jgi:hypothetical protein